MEQMSLFMASDEWKAPPAPSDGWLEIVGKGGKVKQRISVPKGGLSLGRAFDNDVVLDDPYVDPHHLRFFWKGDKLIAEDLDSLNGIYNGKSRQRRQQVDLNGGNVLRVGRTRLRYRDQNFPLPPTLADRSMSAPFALLEKWWFAPFAFLLIMGDTLASTYLQTAEAFEGSTVASALVGIAVFMLIWASCWTFASRLVTQRWNFMIHFGIACTGLLLFSLLEVGGDYTIFAFGMDSARTVIYLIGNTIIFALLLFFHLQFVAQVRSRKLMLASCLVAVAVSSTFQTFSYFKSSKFNAEPTYAVLIKPGRYRLVADQTPAAFFSSVDSLKTAVQQEIDKGK